MGGAGQCQSFRRQTKPICGTTFHEFNGQKGFDGRPWENGCLHVTTGPDDSAIRVHHNGATQMSRFNRPAARDFREQT
jgi:hypothetical protein